MSLQDIRESISSTRKHLASHPEQAPGPDRPAHAVLESGLRCRVEGPDGTVVTTDMPAAVGGNASAPTPGWVSRAALASCDATVIAMRAAELGIRLDRLEVTVESESDARGMVGLDGFSAGPLSVRVRIKVAADGAMPEQLRELVDWAEMHSPVGDVYRRVVVPEIEIESREEEATSP
jgi:uncharacterized OsmC-like protein